jgi:hypothetical protein
MLTLIGYLFVLLTRGQSSKKKLFTIIFIVLGVYLFGTYYNEGNNVLNETILSRLQSDEERGFSGNNRNSLLKTEYFLAMFNNHETMWFGYDLSRVEALN